MARSGKAQAWVAGGVAAVVAIGAAGWFLFVSPQFDAKAEADQRLADAQVQNIVLQKRLDTLREKASHTSELQDQLAQLTQAVPGQHDIQGFTRQLTGFAGEAGVTITSISPSEPSNVTLPEAETPAAEQPGDASAADGGTSSSPATGKQAAGTTSKDGGATGGVYSIAVTVVSTGSMSGQRAFLAAIETQGARRALLTSTALVPVPESADWTLTAQLQIFVAPRSSDDTAQLADQLGGDG